VSFVDIFALTITVAALFSYVNHRWLRMPRAIGLVLMGLAVSAIVAGVGRWLPALQRSAVATLDAIDFNRLVLHGALGVLLFAGALHLNLDGLRRHGVVIAVLSTVGVVLSTIIIGGVVWQTLRLFGIGVPFLDCLLFGALISTTDPIAVLAILRDVRVPPAVEIQLAGESLFNDCVGVVVFLALLRLSDQPDAGLVAVAHATALSVGEALGGVVLGSVLGVLAFLLIKTVDDYPIEILVTLALVAGGWVLAEHLHVSGPMATVVAGLLIGNQGRLFAMSEVTRERLDLFWEIVEEILNAVLFVLIGLLLLTVPLGGSVLVTALVAIAASLLARALSVGLPVVVIRRCTRIATPSVRLMTWAGVRGPLSLALALSLYQRLAVPAPYQISVIVVMTYAVVIFSMAGQGLTLRRVAAWLLTSRDAGTGAAAR
jgi:CPA1 family monovalent cation:H+ antiporter